MSDRSKKGAAVLAAVGAAAAAAFCGTGLFLTRSALYGHRQTLDESYAWQADHYDVSFFDRTKTTDYVIKSGDGYELHAAFVPCAAPSDRYVILTHGYTDTRFGTLKYMKIYLDEGFNCIIYDLRGHGENERTFCTYSIREGEDLKAVIEDTHVRYGEDICLGLHGESLGAATTIRSLMYHPEVEFAVADCGFADIENVLEGVMKSRSIPKVFLSAASSMAKVRYGYSFREMRPIDALPGNKVPILFIHGSEDTFITPDNSIRMKEATDGYAELLLVPGASHANSVLTEPEMYARYVKAFLARAEGTQHGRSNSRGYKNSTQHKQ